MFSTTYSPLSPEAQQAQAERWDNETPWWEDSERWGDTLLSESDVADPDPFEPVSDEDWNAFLEMSWVDPAERDLG